MMAARLLGNLYGFTGGGLSGNVYDTNFELPALTTMQGGGRQPHIAEAKETVMAACRGRGTADGGTAQRLEVRGGVSNALTGVQKDNLAMELYRKGGRLYRIRLRKLTPKECWRAMGIQDSDYEKAAAVNSPTQLYRQAGNGIVVDVLAALFGKVFEALGSERQ